MRKLGGILAIGLLALSACSAPVEATPQPFVGSAPSTTASIEPAPIKSQAVAETEAPATGDFGDPSADARFLEGVKEGWRGAPPADEDLVGAAKFACQEFEAGKMYDEMRPVSGDSDDELTNGVRIAIFAGRVYCTDYNPDNL